MITLCAHTHEKSQFILFFNKLNYEFQDRMLTLHIYFYIVPFYFKYCFSPPGGYGEAKIVDKDIINLLDDEADEDKDDDTHKHYMHCCKWTDLRSRMCGMNNLRTFWLAYSIVYSLTFSLSHTHIHTDTRAN